MRTRVCEQQPLFFSWEGFWAKWLSVDVLEFSIGTQVSTGGTKDHFHNRIKVNGNWVSLPMDKSTIRRPFYGLKFKQEFLPDIANKLKSNVKGPYKDRILPYIKMLEDFDGDLLADLNLSILTAIGKDFFAGSLGEAWVDTSVPDMSIDKTERIIERIRKCAPGPIDYYMGLGAADYLDVDIMKKAGYRLFVHVIDPAIKDESILCMLAQEKNPVELIKSRIKWREI